MLGSGIFPRIQSKGTFRKRAAARRRVAAGDGATDGTRGTSGSVLQERSNILTGGGGVGAARSDMHE